MFIKLLIEALIVGIILCIIGMPVLLYGKNNNCSYMIKLFLIGIFIHLFFEFLGINQWYCKNGYACKKCNI